MFADVQRLTLLRIHTVWAMGDEPDGYAARPDSAVNGNYGKADWNCYQFNRDDAWTKMHDWGCYNWNMVGKMHRRKDRTQKDTKFF